MKVTIFKYRKPANNQNQNYFFGHLQIVDAIVFNRQLIDGFPIFREEWQQEDAVDVIKTGYFDMKYSLLMSERSTLLNRNIYEFFENVSESIKDFRYLVICESGNEERIYSGFINVNTLEANLNTHKNQYHVTYSVTGIDKEAVDYMKQIRLTKINANKPFESDYLPNWHFGGFTGFLKPESRLDINTKISYPLIIDRNVQNSFIDANPQFTVWEGLKSFIIGYGFRFKVTLHSVFANYYPLFKLVLFYRSDGLNETTISKFLDNKKGISLIESKPYIALFLTHREEGESSEVDLYTGLMFTKDNVWVTNQSQFFAYFRNSGEYQISTGEFYTHESEVLKIDLTLYDANLLAGEIAYCRCVQGTEGIYRLLTYVANVQLNYLIQGVKEKKFLKVKVDTDSNLILASKATIDEKSFICERINSFDNYRRTMDTEWIQA